MLLVIRNLSTFDVIFDDSSPFSFETTLLFIIFLQSIFFFFSWFDENFFFLEYWHLFSVPLEQNVYHFSLRNVKSKCKQILCKWCFTTIHVFRQYLLPFNKEKKIIICLDLQCHLHKLPSIHTWPKHSRMFTQKWVCNSHFYIRV